MAASSSSVLTRWAESLADPRSGRVAARVNLMVAGAVFLFLYATTLTVKLKNQVAVFAVVVLGLSVFHTPERAVFGIIALRIVVDMLWWIGPVAGGIGVQQFYSGAVAVFVTVMTAMHGRVLLFHPLVPPFIAYAGFVLIGVTGASSPMFAAEQVARFLTPIILALVVTVICDTERLRWRALAVIVGTGVVPTVLAVVMYVTGLGRTYELDGYLRFLGPYESFQNLAYAMFLFMSLAALFGSSARHRYWKLTWGAYLLACSVITYVTYARTPLVGVGAFLVLFLLLERRLWAFGMAMVFGIAVFSYNAVLQDRFQDVVQLANAENYYEAAPVGSGRIFMWTNTIEDYLEQPVYRQLLGVGPGTQFNAHGLKLDTHHEYLSLLYQVGPFGLAMYLWFQMRVVLDAVWLRANAPDRWNWSFANYILALSAATTVMNSLSNGFVSRPHSAWLYWCLAGVMFSAVHQRKRELRAAIASAAAAPNMVYRRDSQVSSASSPHQV